MSCKFLDGPAKGTTLLLQRAPLFLRLVEDADGKIDALDQLGDAPEPGETIYVYRQVSYDGGGHLSYTDKATRRRKWMWLQSATYAVVDPQPAHDVLGDTEAWRAWCRAQIPAKTEEPKS